MSLTNNHGKTSGRGNGTGGPLLRWLLLLAKCAQDSPTLLCASAHRGLCVERATWMYQCCLCIQSLRDFVFFPA